MTISYTSDIANGGKFVCFWRVLIRWRGSLYKLIWQDLLCYCTLFLIFSYIQTNALPTNLQMILQKLKSYFSANINMFPIPFVLSFFVDQVATKWWHQYQMVPSPDTLAIYTNATIPGKDEKSRMMRRTIVRYAILSLVLTLRNISTRVKNRFPTIKHVQEIGLISDIELTNYDKLESQVTANNWMPLVWAANVASHARSLKKVSSDQCLRLLISELTAHRDKLGILVGYDLVNLPLAYTQTLVVAVVSYTIITLFCHQPVMDDSGFTISGFTLSSITNFIIYVGLMKVATVMLNPFGEDDDDFELNASINRHIKAAYMIVDEMHEEEPEVVKDAFWDEIVPKELPYTVGAAGYRRLEPNCYEGDNHKPMKQSKVRYSVIRPSVKGNKTKNGGFNQHNKNVTSQIAQTNKKSNQLAYENSNNGVINNALSSTDNFMEDEYLYDFPDPPNTFSEMQHPSTSRQYFSQPKRY